MSRRRIIFLKLGVLKECDVFLCWCFLRAALRWSSISLGSSIVRLMMSRALDITCSGIVASKISSHISPIIITNLASKDPKISWPAIRLIVDKANYRRIDQTGQDLLFPSNGDYRSRVQIASNSTFYHSSLLLIIACRILRISYTLSHFVSDIRGSCVVIKPPRQHGKLDDGSGA